MISLDIAQRAISNVHGKRHGPTPSITGGLRSLLREWMPFNKPSIASMRCGGLSPIPRGEDARFSKGLQT